MVSKSTPMHTYTDENILYFFIMRIGTIRQNIIFKTNFFQMIYFILVIVKMCADYYCTSFGDTNDCSVWQIHI